MKRILVTLLVGAALLSASASTTHAQGNAPFWGTPPNGWTWWNDTGGYLLLLPTDAVPGEQTRFFIVAAGDRDDVWLPGWMGGGEIIWRGRFEAAGWDWQAQVAKGNGLHGLVGTAGNGDVTAWSLAAVSPEAMWEADAQVYNAILRGVEVEQ